MNFKANYTPNTSCRHCTHIFRRIYLDLREIKSQTSSIHHRLIHKENEETILRDANYVIDRVGISMSTLLREQEKGRIKVAEIRNRRRLYRDQDVERFRKEYWRLED